MLFDWLKTSLLFCDRLNVSVVYVISAAVFTARQHSLLCRTLYYLL